MRSNRELRLVSVEKRGGTITPHNYLKGDCSRVGVGLPTSYRTCNGLRLHQVLSWIIGNIFSSEGLSITGTGHPGK